MPDAAYRTRPLCEATCGVEPTIDDRREGTTPGRLHADPDRRRAPRIRRDEGWEEVSRAEAFAYLAARFEAVVAAGGPQTSAVYPGRPLPT